MPTPESPYLYQIISGNPIASYKNNIIYNCHFLQKNLDGSTIEKTWRKQIIKQSNPRLKKIPIKKL
jgi:hypothetical protein